MAKQYERLAGTEEALLLKEALEKLSNGSLSASLEGKVDMLLNELREARMQREREVELLIENSSQAPPPVDIPAIVEKICTMTNKATPTYSFTIERNHSGVLTGIKATPTI
jgi:hypothetical protein